MVSFTADDAIVHTRFTELPSFLRAGDVLVVNTSATLNAALAARRPNGESVLLHLSQRRDSGRWVVELRRVADTKTTPLLNARAGERLELAGGGTASLLAPYLRDGVRPHPAHTRLWVAEVDLAGDDLRYLNEHGSPIRYAYVPERWPLRYYQTIFAAEPGSAEMASAGRPFTGRMVEQLRQLGITIAPILLHAGVASLEAHEPPYPEYYRVSARTASAVNDARRRGGRIIAIGTTSVRALETVAAPNGSVSPGEGWTGVTIGPERALRAVDGLLTGLHEPRASHLAMLESLAGPRHLRAAYEEALREGYLWHEFGDVHLILPA